MPVNRVNQRIRRPIESYNMAWLGLISIVVIGVVLVSVVVVGRLDLGKTQYRAEFVQAAQLKPGNQVTVAGVQVGTVRRVERSGDHVVVTFKVDNDVHVGEDSRAAIKLTTILGARYLELRPAGSADLDNRTLPLGSTEVPYDLQSTLAGSTTAFGPIDADRVVGSVQMLNDNLQGLPAELPTALDNLNEVATILADRREQIGSLLTHADSVTAMLRDQRADLGVLVLQGSDLLREIAQRRESLQQLFASITTLVDRAATIMSDDPAINQLLADAEEFTRTVTEHDALVRNILQTAPVTMRNMANATGSGNAWDVNVPGGILIDSWMCAISGRAKQFNLVEYFKDCQ